MSIYYSGGFSRSAGLVSAIRKQLKLINLKAVQKVTVTFDPFVETTKSTREFLFQLSTPKISLTNPKCSLKSDIVCSRQASEIKFKLNEPAESLAKVKEIKFLSDNLTLLELLQLCNQHISILAPKEDPITAAKTTKSDRKGAGGGIKKNIKKK